MKPFLYVAMILVSAGLIALILLQIRGSSLSGLFGGDGAIYRTKRGVEKTLFNATIGVAILFFVLATVIVLVH
ncbi:MAG: preprotein translocase subunit SecG [Anaerolineae bacterium]|nr:preprotein translocase subunit SecG [Anaerolineae bacterium]